MSGITGFFKKKFKQPVSNTALLLTITICTFVVMYILAMAVWGGGFLNPQQFFNIFNNNAYLIIIACGLTIVMISGGIDISVGGQVALITMTTVCFLENRGGSVFGALVIALAIGLAFGAVQGFLISYLKIQPFIVTLAGMFFAKGMTTIVSVNPVTVKANEFFLKLKEFTINIPGIGQHTRSGMFINSYLEIGAVVAILAVVILWAALKWTRIGRNFYAIGGNSESALMLGINVQRTRFLAYLICGLLAGIAGFVYLLHTGAGNASNADGAEMEAIASSIIGGTLLTGGVGSLIGTLFGVMSLKTITTIVITSGLTQPWWQKITTGLMLCFFILLQSVILSYRKKKLGAKAA
ncbi:MAG: sugar ABC transporter permease YjfF [Treponema sp.]|nr:sugar ABC transporter permease YjfF [Treponema sp.]